MKRYRIAGSSDPAFMDIEMNIVFDDISIGKGCEVFGHQFTITQTGKCIVLSNPDWVLTLLEIPNPDDEIKWGHTITDYKELRVNHEVDIFIFDKKIKLTKTDRLTDAGVSVRTIYDFLANEWKYIDHFVNTPFPFEYDYDYKLLKLNDDWDFFDGDSIKLVRDGSFSRYNAEGRCI